MSTPAFQLDHGLDSVPDKVRSQMRHRALTESYYMATMVLGYDKLTPRAHGPFCTFIDTCRGKRRLMQMPRSHLKTTISTIVHRIQRAMADTSLRTLIIGDTDTNAEKHLQKIKRHLEANGLLRWLFPDKVWENPEAQAQAWSKKELYLPNHAAHGEPAFDAIGAGSAVVSRHYDCIAPDDLIGQEEYYSETEMDKIIEWATGLESLFVPPEDQCQMDIVGTYWRTDDVYAFFEKFFGRNGEKIPTGPYSYRVGALDVFRRGVFHEDGNLIYPEGISLEFINRLREINPERYAAQYANNPSAAGVAYFHPEYLRYYNWRVQDHVIAYTPQGGSPQLISRNDLQILSFCDPHAGGSTRLRFGGGRAAVVTTGTHKGTGRIFVLDTWIRRAPTDRIITEIIRQNEQWQPELFSIEANGLQKMIRPWLDERVMREGRPSVPYYPYIPRGEKDSERRIKGLQPLFRAGQIVIQEGFHELIEEYLAWPRGMKDGLDALAQGLEQWDITWDKVTDEELAEYEMDLRRFRSVVTGY